MKELLEVESFFVIRTPRLSVDKLLCFNNPETNIQLEIENWLDQSGVIEALYLASPSLVERIKQWRDNTDGKSSNKIKLSLLRYMIRMHSRSTPFGLFSGISLGKVCKNTNFVCNDYKMDSRKTRFDIFYLLTVKDYITKKINRSLSLNYRPNSTHYFLGNQCRYIESYVSDETLRYQLSAIDCDEYFAFVIECARLGVSVEYLKRAFCLAYPNVEHEEVSDYIQNIIDEGMLLADIPIPLTGASPDETLVNSILNNGGTETADILNMALSILSNIDQVNSGSIEPYKQILKCLQQLPINVQENKLFQCDSFRSFINCELSLNELDSIKELLILIAELADFKRINPLGEFISKFNNRFEGQFIRLDLVLDDESGIGISNETGYESSLIKGLKIYRQNDNKLRPNKVSLIGTEILRALSLPSNRGLDCIVLDSKELKRKLDKNVTGKEFPASFAAILSLYEDLQGNPVSKFNGCYGPSAANLLGRFCHLDSDLLTYVKAHLEREASHSPEVIFAEVAHMPNGRPGNVIARPHLRKYEIVFMADSSLDIEYQIPISDLYVWVEGDKVKLWSKRLNKRIVPRLSSAHNYSTGSLSVYKFLCMLQHQDGKPPSFQMPTETECNSFVPRIMLDNLILNEKTWRIERTELSKLLTSDMTLDESKWLDLKKRYRIDEKVSFSVADNILILNLRCPEMVNILLAETKNFKIVELTEVLTINYRSRVKDVEGCQYNNEVIVPFFNFHADKFQNYCLDPLSNINSLDIARRFVAGSEWLSLKIYSGNSVVEQLLCEDLLDFITKNKALFSKWFFIRYGDPSWHIRVRFQGNPQLLCGELLPKLSSLFQTGIETGVLHKVELMTYEREVERYGGPETIVLVESLFMFDSELVAKVCALIPEYGDELRIRIAFPYIYRLLCLFDYNLEEQLVFISNLRNGLGKEFSESTELRRQLGSSYRKMEFQLNDDFRKLAMNISDDFTISQKQLHSILSEWQQRAEPVISEIKILFSNNEVNCTLDVLLGSLLHMHNNRLFKAYGREQEFVVYDMLRRKYFAMQKCDLLI